MTELTPTQEQALRRFARGERRPEDHRRKPAARLDAGDAGGLRLEVPGRLDRRAEEGCGGAGMSEYGGLIALEEVDEVARALSAGRKSGVFYDEELRRAIEWLLQTRRDE